LPRLALQLDLDKAHRRIAGVDDVVLDPGFATIGLARRHLEARLAGRADARESSPRVRSTTR
jgi:hypothetical protein